MNGARAGAKKSNNIIQTATFDKTIIEENYTSSLTHSHSHSAPWQGKRWPRVRRRIVLLRDIQKAKPGLLPSYLALGFPTSRDRWGTTFQEEECSWFDAYSLTDIHARQDLQIDGLRESISHVLDLLESEIRLLGGQSNRVYLGGISQGMARALWALFCATRRVPGQLGGFVGFCGWFPFARQVEEFETANSPSTSGEKTEIQQRQVLDFFLDTIAHPETSPADAVNNASILSTPVFLSHGTDDPWVSVELGRQASRVVRQIMDHVEWSEFIGADGDGHWIKEPEGFDRVLHFLEKCIQS